MSLYQPVRAGSVILALAKIRHHIDMMEMGRKLFNATSAMAGPWRFIFSQMCLNDPSPTARQEFQGIQLHHQCVNVFPHGKGEGGHLVPHPAVRRATFGLLRFCRLDQLLETVESAPVDAPGCHTFACSLDGAIRPAHGRAVKRRSKSH